MAISSSKTKEISSVNGSTSYNLQVSFKENSTNISNNTSNITLTAKLSCNGSYWSTSYNSTIQLYWHDNKNNTDQLVKTLEFAGLSSKNDTKSVSKTIDVAHNNDGSLKGYAKAVFTKGSTTTGWAPQNGNVSTANTWLSDIPRQANLNSGPNFTDEANPTITYTNSAGNSVTELKACISLTGGNDDVPYRDVPKDGTSYTFELTEQERNTLRNATPNSNDLPVKFYLRTLIGGNYYYSVLNRSMTIVNGYPTFTNFNFYDSNTDITAVTGNNQCLVKGYSNLVVSIPSANKMIANKGSNPNQYVATVDDKNVSVAYSDNDITIPLGSFQTTGTKELWVKAYDTRNSWYGIIKRPVVYDYEKPVINATIVRDNNYENTTRLNVNGKYSLLTINNVNKNTLTDLQYRYRETNGTWGNWTNLNPTLDNGNYSCSEVVLSLDNHKSFEFEIRAIDNIDTTVATLNVDEGKFIFFISTNKKCYIDDKEVATLDSVYPVGSIYMSINNTNPSTLFGGTWEQIQGRFLLGAGNNGASGNEALNTNAGATGGETNHTLNTSEIPSHYHEADEVNHMFLTSNGNIALNSTKRAWWTNQGTADKHFVYTSVDNLGISEHRNTTSTGGGGAHNNLPPYLSVYIWKRTA